MATPATRLEFAPPLGVAATPKASPQGVPHPHLDGWLDRVCGMIPGVEHACIAWPDADMTPLVWPVGAEVDTTAVAIARETAATQADAGLRPAPGAGLVYLARPLPVGPVGRAALVLRLPAPADAHRATLDKLLRWSDAWLGFLDAADATPPRPEHPGHAALTLLQAGLGATDAGAAATAMAAQIAAALAADTAAIGLVSGDELRLAARSHTASFDARTRANRDVVAAMTEVIDEDTVIAVASTDNLDAGGRRAHRALTDALAASAVCSVPLRTAAGTIGAVTVIRHAGSAFSPTEQDALGALADEIARVLALRAQAERGLASQLRATVAGHLAALTGPGYQLRKSGLIALVLALLALTFIPADYRVAAPATLAGRVERTVVAPIDGYVAEAPARAGDAVRAGDLLAVLDTRELEFERRRLLAERTEAEKASRQAVATMDRAEAAIAKARMGMADSKLALIDAQIARARIVAPFAGIVIAGDLSRAMGAPVSRGDVLFELAPLDDYRVELEVDERYIAALEPGQTGQLALTGLAGSRMPFTVERVVGVSEIGRNGNVFKVEAALEGDVSLLRPGMRGVAKVSTGRRPLGWVWTHDLIDRARILLWTRTL